MTAGASGSYAVNGVTFLPPTSGRWLPKNPIGVSGDGHAIYSGVREFELRWQLAFPSDVYQLQNFFGAINNTGTAVVDLPKYGHSSYEFYSYSGCVLREPEQGEYFSENQTDILLLVTNVRT